MKSVVDQSVRLELAPEKNPIRLPLIPNIYIPAMFRAAAGLLSPVASLGLLTQTSMVRPPAVTTSEAVRMPWPLPTPTEFAVEIATVVPVKLTDPMPVVFCREELSGMSDE